MNALPIFHDRPDEEKFRNPIGVTLKLSNFLPFDETYKGKGMSGGSKLDEEIFKAFENKREELRAIASQIRQVVFDEKLNRRVAEIEDDDMTTADGVLEGQKKVSNGQLFGRGKTDQLKWC